MRTNRFLVAALSTAALALCFGCGGSTPPCYMLFQGECSSLPNPASPVHAGWAANGYGVLVYGLGREDTSDCVHGTADADLFDGTGVPDDIGVPVTGAGNLDALRVSATAPGATPQSGKVIVYINGVPSNMACTLGIAMACSDPVHTPRVSGNDLISATIQLMPGDEITGLQVNFGKE